VGEAAPGIFVAGAPGWAVGQAVYSEGGRQTVQSLVGVAGANPVDVNAGDVYLVLYGTGMRGAGGSVRASVGGTGVSVLYLVAQPEFPGLDQVAVGPLPRGLAGRGSVTVVVEVAGVESNGAAVVVR
jgi:uncharacterized protein (TIGR03437 family)